MANFIFHRPEVAEQLASALLGDNPLFQAGRSGLFLAGPRRTGKSTFLRNDLIPVLESRGALVIYVDLWSDKTRNPGELIADAIRSRLETIASAGRKAIDMLGKVRKASVKAKLTGFEAELGFELDTIGKATGATLVQAFEGIRRTAQKQIVFILDEAQHALSTSEGASTLFALKAARDALNLTADRPGLAILATGSVRSKIADLVSRKSQAFYGATVSDFPPLGKDFVRFLVDSMLSHRLSKARLPDIDKVSVAFDLLGRRPEELRKAIQDAVTRPEPDLGDAVMAAARDRHAEIVADLRSQFERLPPLQRSILRLMAEQNEAFSAFGKASVERYRVDTGNANLTWTAAQKSLEALIRDGLVWRSAHGAYSIDDEVLANFLFDKNATLLLADQRAARTDDPPVRPPKRPRRGGQRT
jgi:hypothetical protein